MLTNSGDQPLAQSRRDAHEAVPRRPELALPLFAGADAAVALPIAEFFSGCVCFGL